MNAYRTLRPQFLANRVAPRGPKPTQSRQFGSLHLENSGCKASAQIGGSRVDVMRRMMTVREIVGLVVRWIEVGHLLAERRCDRRSRSHWRVTGLPGRFEWCRW